MVSGVPSVERYSSTMFCPSELVSAVSDSANFADSDKGSESSRWPGRLPRPVAHPRTNR